MQPTKLELKYEDGLPEVLTYLDVAEALGLKTIQGISRLVKTGELTAVGVSRSKRITTKSFLAHLERVIVRPQMAHLLSITTAEAARIQRKAVAQPLPPPRDSELEEAWRLQSQYPALRELDPKLIIRLQNQGYTYGKEGWQEPYSASRTVARRVRGV